MPKKALIFFAKLTFWLLASSVCFSQGSVNGKIADGNGSPLDKASVLLLKSEDSSLVRGLMTTNTGSYYFTNLAPGTYLIHCSYTGFKTAYTSLFQIQKDELRELGVLTLSEQDDLLGEVTVNVRRPMYEQKVDRMIINVANSITNAGSTALDVLMRSPGITVNQQNNTLSMNGKEGVFVMINGKLNRMPMEALVQLLSGMSSANIERIELITTPPANFDAEGNAGFINIILKQNLEYGTNGSFSVAVGHGIGGGPILSGNIHFNHRKKNWNLYGNYSFSKITPSMFLQVDHKIINGNTSIYNQVIRHSDDFIRNHNARIGIDYEITRNTTAGILISSFSNLYGMDAVNKSNIYLNGILDTIILIDQSERKPLENLSTNFNLQHRFKRHGQLIFNIDYIVFNYANRLNYFHNYYNKTNSFLYDEKMRSVKETPINFWVASMDYSHNLSPKTSLEFGAKATISNFVNDVLVEKKLQSNWETEKDFTSTHTLQESILAAYASSHFKGNDRNSATISLRYEYTNSNLGSELVKNIVDRKYGQLFPSILLTHKLNKKNSFNFSYSRRISRPTFNDMAPFVYFVDPNTFISGNPALQPAIANAVKWDYLLNRFVFSLSYTHENQTITNFAPTVDPHSNKQTMTAANQPGRHIAVLNVTVPLTVTAWWSMQMTMTGQWQQLNAIYKEAELTLKQSNLNFNATQTFTLPKNYSIELNAFFLSGGLFGIYKMGSMSSLNLGVQKKFGAGGGALLLNITDFSGPPISYWYVDAPEHNLVTSLKIRGRVSTVRLTYSKKFGNVKIKGKRERVTGAEEERSRVITN